MQDRHSIHNISASCFDGKVLDSWETFGLVVFFGDASDATRNDFAIV